MTRALLAVAAAAALIALAAPTGAGAQDATLPDVEDEVMCTICGTPLEHSFSPQADRQRDFIRRLIAEGRDKEEIKTALVAEYGEDVLAVPDDEGFDLLAWLIPILGLAAACVAILLALRRLRREPAPAGATAPDERLDPSDLARLDEDMSKREA
jgi:cytochrome c-type biogenesis protein CcmH/NrfF